MSNKLFIDSDIILDVILQRETHFVKSMEILLECEQGKYRGFTSSLAMANIHYILTRQKIENPSSIILKISKILNILNFEKDDIFNSMTSGFKDFEDGIQHSIAIRNGCDRFATRNLKDYTNSKIPLLDLN